MCLPQSEGEEQEEGLRYWQKAIQGELEFYHSGNKCMHWVCDGDLPQQPGTQACHTGEAFHGPELTG